MQPSVGIFWRVGDGALVTDRTALASAEPYGECLTHARGHYEVWERWRRLPATASLPGEIVDHEYEDFPRGRVVYHRPSERFWIYADRRLQEAVILEEIRGAFGLPGDRCLVRSDPHYR